MTDFNHAVEIVDAWVRENSNWGETLLIMTGDHETGYLSGSEDGLTPIGVMPEMFWNSDEHTNQLVPLFAKGHSANAFNKAADSEDPVRGKYIDNTDVPNLIRKAINVQCRSNRKLIFE